MVGGPVGTQGGYQFKEGAEQYQKCFEEFWECSEPVHPLQQWCKGICGVEVVKSIEIQEVGAGAEVIKIRGLQGGLEQLDNKSGV